MSDMRESIAYSARVGARAGAKLGLLQIESWISDEVAVGGRALQGPKGGVALGNSWFAGLLPEPWMHITGHTGLTGPTGQGGG